MNPSKSPKRTDERVVGGIDVERILSAAVRGQVRMGIQAESWPAGTKVSAAVHSIKPGAIVIRLSQPDAAKLGGVVGPVNARIMVDGTRYTFGTRVLTRRSEDVVELARPRQIALRRRRRSHRYRLPRGVVVEIHDVGGGELLCSGTLMNMSCDGIAAKASLPEQTPCRGGLACRVQFQLSAETPAFDLPATITNMTPAGESEHVVLGMELIHAADGATRRALSDALGTLGRPGGGA